MMRMLEAIDKDARSLSEAVDWDEVIRLLHKFLDEEDLDDLEREMSTILKDKKRRIAFLGSVICGKMIDYIQNKGPATEADEPLRFPVSAKLTAGSATFFTRPGNDSSKEEFTFS